MSFRSEEKRDSLPMLKYIMENRNTTTYQWRTGQKPEVIEEAKVFIDTSEENEVGQVTDDVSYFYLRSVNGSSGNELPKGIKLKCFYFKFKSYRIHRVRLFLSALMCAFKILAICCFQIDWGDPGAMTESAIDFGDEIDFNMADITVETGGTEEGDQVVIFHLFVV